MHQIYTISTLNTPAFYKIYKCHNIRQFPVSLSFWTEKKKTEKKKKKFACTRTIKWISPTTRTQQKFATVLKLLNIEKKINELVKNDFFCPFHSMSARTIRSTHTYAVGVSEKIRMAQKREKFFFFSTRRVFSAEKHFFISCSTCLYVHNFFFWLLSRRLQHTYVCTNTFDYTLSNNRTHASMKEKMPTYIFFIRILRLLTEKLRWSERKKSDFFFVCCRCVISHKIRYICGGNGAYTHRRAKWKIGWFKKVFFFCSSFLLWSEVWWNEKKT